MTISATSGSSLAQAQALFEQASADSPASPTGATAQPAEAAQDTQDQPDPTYPALMRSHVLVLQAIGTSAEQIAQLNAAQPTAAYMDDYIQNEIMQNPEGWDDLVGNPRGTARAGLQKLIPGVQLPAPAQPGLVNPDGSVPTGPGTEAEGLVKGAVILAAIGGAGFAIWKFAKGRGSAGSVKNAADDVARIADQGGPEVIAQMATLLGRAQSAGGEVGPDAMRAALVLSAARGRGGSLGDFASISARTAHAATIDAIAQGAGPVDGTLLLAIRGAELGNMSVREAAEISLAGRQMGVYEQLAARAHDPGDVAAVLSAMGDARTAAGSAPPATRTEGLNQVFTGLANLTS